MTEIGDRLMRVKFVFLIFTVICTLLLHTGCQQQTEIEKEPEKISAIETSPAKQSPKITFESLEYDFGTVGPRGKLIGEFKFTNTGNAPLKITKVEKCCGAITRLDKNDYAPGESGVLNVEYRSGSTASTMTKRLYVNSNDKENPRTTLTIKAKVELRVTWEPKSMKFLIKGKKIDCPEITIKSTKGQPFSVTKFQSTGDCITADIDNSIEAAKIILQPKIDLEKIQKRRSGRIYINLDYPGLDVASEKASISFRALSRFSTRPSIIVALYNENREPLKKSLRITNNYGEEFEIESISSKEGYIEVLGNKKIGKTTQLELQITPPVEENVKRFNDKLTINIKDGEKLDVTCQGIYSVRKNRITQGGL